VAKQYNLYIEQSATFQHTVFWKDPSGTPIDLTGYRIRLQVRESAAATEVLLDFDSDAPASGMAITTLDDAGNFTITFTPAVTEALDFRFGDYDLTATSPGGVVYRLHEGKASVRPGVTR
jgi:hypothetical protein